MNNRDEKDEPKPEPQPIESPELWQLIDWIFFASGGGEEDEEERGADESGSIDLNKEIE